MSPDMLDAGPYMDQARAIRNAERMHAIMAAWHRDHHGRGAYLRCEAQPCRDLNRQAKA